MLSFFSFFFFFYLFKAPEEYRNRPGCANISDSNRRTYCGMMAAVDEGVGRIVDTLRQQGVLDDTIVFFTSDNGAALNTHASPWPLRGNKQTIYEVSPDCLYLGSNCELITMLGLAGGCRATRLLCLQESAPKSTQKGNTCVDILQHILQG